MSKTQRELKALRQAQRDEAQRRQRSRERRNLLLIVLALVLAGAFIFGVAFYLSRPTGEQVSGKRLPFQAQTGTAGTEVPDEGTATHIDPSQTWPYKNFPPSSGPHYGSPTAPVAWGAIRQLREGEYLHNLEHGGIAILYNCPSGDACNALRDQLSNYVRTLAPAEPQFGEVKMVMSPYAHGMTHKIALVAWHWIEELDAYDENAITRFYEIHVDQGPERIP